MALNLFGLAPSDVRAHHFPMWSALSTTSSPTLATVTQKLDEAAAEVAGRLNKEAIDASDIEADSPAYLKCRKAVRIECALELAKSASGIDGDLVKSWRTWLDAFYEELAESGATGLGGGATSTSSSDPDGPTSHISEYSLTTDEADDMSSAVPSLRKDDRL